MLLAAPGGRSIDGRLRVAVSAIATARAIALLTAVFLLALPHAARAQDDAASAAAASAVIASLPHDLSPWSMFMNADIVEGDDGGSRFRFPGHVDRLARQGS